MPLKDMFADFVQSEDGGLDNVPVAAAPAAAPAAPAPAAAPAGAVQAAAPATAPAGAAPAAAPTPAAAVVAAPATALAAAPPGLAAPAAGSVPTQAPAHAPTRPRAGATTTARTPGAPARLDIYTATMKPMLKSARTLVNMFQERWLGKAATAAKQRFVVIVGRNALVKVWVDEVVKNPAHVASFQDANTTEMETDAMEVEAESVTEGLREWW